MVLTITAVERQAWLITFCLVLLDSMFTYFIKTYTGALFPVNASLPILIFIFGASWGFSRLMPPFSTVSIIIFGLMGFVLYAIFIINFEIGYINQVATSALAFIVGYRALIINTDANKFMSYMLWIGLLYIVICVIALLRIAPSLFPVVYSYGFHNGVPFARPEVTVDQNFQIFYLYPGLLALLLPVRKMGFWLAIIALLGASYVLIQLQTRSGVLILGLLFVITLLTPLWYQHLGRSKIFIIPVGLIILIMFNLETLLNLSQGLINRVNTEDNQTIFGRLYSAEYMFEHLLDLEYWIPQGNTDFIAKTGVLPHFTPTAYFLEGGILGLICWVLLIFVPTIKLGVMYLQRRLDTIAIVILFAGFTSILIQLTLNAPFFKHTWLWAGAVMAVYHRMCIETRNNLEQKKQISKPQNKIIRHAEVGKPLRISK